MMVKWNDVLTNRWKGPSVLLLTGRGYACVFTEDEDSPIWIPDWLFRVTPQETTSSMDAHMSTELKSNEEATDEVEQLIYMAQHKASR